MPPEKPSSDVVTLLQALSRRPAMNGGFKKVARQQTLQVRKLERLERRLIPIEAFISQWSQRQKWITRGVGAIAVGVFTELAIKLVDHVHLALK